MNRRTNCRLKQIVRRDNFSQLVLLNAVTDIVANLDVY